MKIAAYWIAKYTNKKDETTCFSGSSKGPCCNYRCQVKNDENIITYLLINNFPISQSHSQLLNKSV